ncbi:MAG TPA: acyl-CoA dehydrogenase family protein [Jatrophihabitantaceae bacterium]|jgi:alkylation response protein AidB-like acyl-CoA dehydrogenase|nr:acyl-CoA dehydrogenase family protein [Jatrophihabitantaceae bacterium]
MLPDLWTPDLSDDERIALELAGVLTVKQFGPRAEEVDRTGEYPWDHVAALAEANLLGAFIPAEYGGPGQSLSATCAVVERVSTGCASTGAILAAYALGAFPLMLAGTKEQKQRYLPGIVRGKAVSFALTERGAGSDVKALTTTAEPAGRGCWRIRGEKIYIGNGGVAEHYVVFTKTRRGGRGELTAFMVSSAADGVVVDHYEDKMGIRGTTTSNLKLDTVVEEGDILGEVGGGLWLALQTLVVGRVTVAAQSVGLGLAALEAAAGHAAGRSAFGKVIIDHQGIGFQLADVATQLTAARLMTFQAARAYDEGRDVSVLGAMTKLFASEAAHLAADVAVQVYGGAGYCKPCIAERLYRDQRVLQIYEGSSEIQRLIIAGAVKSSTAPAC